MIEPPKFSPLSGTDDANSVPASGKPSGHDAARCNAANPVQPLFRLRMFPVRQLNPMWVEKRFDSLCETYSVLPDVLDIFCKVPFEFHCDDDTISVARAPDRRLSVTHGPRLHRVQAAVCLQGADRWWDWFIMGLEASKIPGHGILDIGDGFLAGVPLTHATWEGWTISNVDAVFILFEHNTVSHRQTLRADS